MPLSDKPFEGPFNFRMEDNEEDYFEMISIEEAYDQFDGSGNSSPEMTDGYDGISSEDDEHSDNLRLSCVPLCEHASLVFKNHTGPVFCVGINPKNEKMIVSGGQDDKAFVWDSQTGEILLESNNFLDSVTFASFNYNGKYLAAVDMSGKIIVWQLTEHPFQVIWEYKIDDVQWMKWHTQANVLLAAENSGCLYLWKMPSGECKVFPSSHKLLDVGGFMPDGLRAVACYANGSVSILDLATASVTMSYGQTDTSRPETFVSLDVHPDNNLVALGTVLSRLFIIKTQGFKSIQKYDCIEQKEKGNDVDKLSTSVECVAFSRKLPYHAVVAATNNALHIIDYSRCEERGYIPVAEGITRFIWPEQSHSLYVGTRVGKIAVFDVRAMVRTATIEGHSRIIFDLGLTKDRKTLVTASDDKTVRIFPADEIVASLYEA